MPITNYDNYPSETFTCFTFWSEFVHLKVSLWSGELGLFFLADFSERPAQDEGNETHVERDLQDAAQLPAQWPDEKELGIWRKLLFQANLSFSKTI